MSTPVTPARPAASLLLLRDGDAGLEVLHLRRAATMAFSPDATAFPGGRVDPADDALLALPAPAADAWARRMGLDAHPVESLAEDAPGSVAARLLAAAVRETFEETGVLLARTAEGVPADPTALAALESHRDAVERHEEDLGALLAARGLTPDATGLRAWQRWITPVSVPRRYDTVFFLVALPAGQAPRRISSEAASHGWATPSALLADFRAGRVTLMAPTWAQLRALEGVESVADAIDAAAPFDEAGRPAGPVPVVRLRPEATDAERAQEFEHAEQYLADLRSFRARAQTPDTPDNIL